MLFEIIDEIVADVGQSLVSASVFFDTLHARPKAFEEVVPSSLRNHDHGVPFVLDCFFDVLRHGFRAVGLEERVFVDEAHVDLPRSQSRVACDVTSMASHELDDADSVGLVAGGFRDGRKDGLGSLLNCRIEPERAVDHTHVVIDSFGDSCDNHFLFACLRVLVQAVCAPVSSVSANDVQHVDAIRFKLVENFFDFFGRRSGRDSASR
mmetsp:Transcript_16538/g.29693  ORF Transcript_16538/g.29693 Transcript_16538/m.29693 type:complete len:208 (-) Transcript_16538:1075-1698(-)